MTWLGLTVLCAFNAVVNLFVREKLSKKSFKLELLQLSRIVTLFLRAPASEKCIVS